VYTDGEKMEIIEEFGFEEDSIDFSDAMEAFGKSILIESKINYTIEHTSISRNMLWDFIMASDTSMAPLGNEIPKIMDQMGLGTHKVKRKDSLMYEFSTSECNVCDLYPEVKEGFVCHITAEAIHRFFREIFGVMTEVEETSCVKNGDGYCKFQVRFQPYSIIFNLMDSVDREILQVLSSTFIEDCDTLSSIVSKADIFLEPSDLNERMIFYSTFHLVEGCNISGSGRQFLRMLQSNDSNQNRRDAYEPKMEQKQEEPVKKDVFGDAFEDAFNH